MITVDGLSKGLEELHPVQEAMVRNSGAQCGFCTPGFVMSMYGLFLKTKKPNRAQILNSIQGNLCRCTGYGPIISAAEDIGLANPTALVMANSCFNALQKIGWPEGRILLAQCTIYLALSPKSNSAYQAINKAQEKVNEFGDLSVPLHLRNAPTELMKDLSLIHI